MPSALPILNRSGTILQAFLDVPEYRLETSLEYPLTHALVVARHAGRSLLLFNRFKQQWELPGGIIEAGESARSCAARELEEETDQRSAALAFRGLMHVSFPSGKNEYGALYVTELGEVRPFTQSEEAERITFWDGREEIGYVNEIDAALLAYG